ncbi:MAG TPA: hypothetical protein VG370_27200 [Chloroflexota bacterium]|jgi:hypothetical protein|nr:hypothetical protein [Chloroflexota bacterium]
MDDDSTPPATPPTPDTPAAGPVRQEKPPTDENPAVGALRMILSDPVRLRRLEAILRRIEEEDERKKAALLPSVTCPRCGFVTHKPEDVADPYCERCAIFHDLAHLLPPYEPCGVGGCREDLGGFARLPCHIHPWRRPRPKPPPQPVY